MPIKAIQQFQLRNELISHDKAQAALGQVYEAGFQGIELCGYLIDRLPWRIRMLTRLAGMPIGRSGTLDWVRLIAESGLQVVAIHDDLESILRDPRRIAVRARRFNTQTIVITGQRRFDYSDKAAVLNLAEKLNEAGRLLRDENLSLLYHNHNCELAKIDGQLALEILIDATDASCVNFEYDSYWPAEAGYDPLRLMHRLGSRMKLYHINDRGFRSRGPTGSIIKSDSMELGLGNMPLVDLVDAAKSYAVNAVILESHGNWHGGSAIQSMQISSSFMNAQV